MQSNHAVLLPESFRGGCSFGAGKPLDQKLPVSPDVIHRTGHPKHGFPKAVNVPVSYQRLQGLAATA
jgi:hypothetical protein